MEGIFLSVVIPAYNEEKTIAGTLEDIARHLLTKVHTHEVIVVDDGSRDRTCAIAEDFSHRDAHVRVVKSPQNEGKGAALKRGFMAARGKYILFLDADYSTRIEEADKMLGLLERDERYDFVIGSRAAKGAHIVTPEPFLRILLGTFYHFLVVLFLVKGVGDYNCGFKLYRAKAAKDLFSRLIARDYTFDAEMFFLAGRLGYRFMEMPVTWRHGANSKVRPLRDGVRALGALIGIRLNYYRGLYDSNGAAG